MRYLFSLCLALLGVSSAAEEARHLIVEFAVPSSFEGAAIEGTTNLPDNTELIVSLQTPLPCFPNCRYDSGKATVKGGHFTTWPFRLSPGIYTLEITTSMAELEPANVRAIIGAHGENLRGPHIKPELIPGGGLTVDYISRVTVLPKR